MKRVKFIGKKYFIELTLFGGVKLIVSGKYLNEFDLILNGEYFDLDGNKELEVEEGLKIKVSQIEKAKKVRY